MTVEITPLQKHIVLIVHDSFHFLNINYLLSVQKLPASEIDHYEGKMYRTAFIFQIEPVTEYSLKLVEIERL